MASGLLQNVQDLTPFFNIVDLAASLYDFVSHRKTDPGSQAPSSQDAKKCGRKNIVF